MPTRPPSRPQRKRVPTKRIGSDAGFTRRAGRATLKGAVAGYRKLKETASTAAAVKSLATAARNAASSRSTPAPAAAPGISFGSVTGTRTATHRPLPPRLRALAGRGGTMTGRTVPRPSISRFKHFAKSFAAAAKVWPRVLSRAASKAPKALSSSFASAAAYTSTTVIGGGVVRGSVSLTARGLRGLTAFAMPTGTLAMLAESANVTVWNSMRVRWELDASDWDKFEQQAKSLIVRITHSTELEWAERVRDEAINSIKFRRGSSRPGQPPHAHELPGIGDIRVGFDRASDSVIVGPVLHTTPVTSFAAQFGGQQPRPAPHVLEFGGDVTMKTQRFFGTTFESHGVDVVWIQGEPWLFATRRVAARPFMRPALEKHLIDGRSLAGRALASIPGISPNEARINQLTRAGVGGRV